MLAIHNSPGSHRGQSALSGSQDFRIMNYNHLPARDRNYEIQRYTPNLQMMPPPSAEQIKPGKLDTPLKIIKTVVITIIKSWHCTGPLFIANKNSSTFFRVNRVKSHFFRCYSFVTHCTFLQAAAVQGTRDNKTADEQHIKIRETLAWPPEPELLEIASSKENWDAAPGPGRCPVAVLYTSSRDEVRSSLN